MLKFPAVYIVLTWTVNICLYIAFKPAILLKYFALNKDVIITIYVF